MKSWYSLRARAGGAEISIYDEIGAYGVSAKGFLAELGALPDAAPIDLRLNSPGGSVFDAVAIHNALKRHEGPVTVWIDGIAASAASYVAMAGDEIIMPENAFLMIHDPAGLVMGTAADMRAMAEALDKVKGSLVAGYAAKSGRAAEDIAALMTAETWFDARDALDAGLATRIAEPVRMVAAFDIARFRNAPPELVEAVAAEDTDDVEPAAELPAPAEPGEAGVPAGNTPSAATDPEPTPAKTPPPIGTPPDPVTIRAEAIAHARAVIDLCRLAGQPQLAGRFLDGDASLDEVRATLLAAKAEAEPEIAPHHPQPGPSPTTRPWGDVIARTFKLKG
ncbi:head maturation protease, ClpP-related [Pararhodobacter sp. SW119]|uniref:head maturation protease, ClpP-related n=1 Tax=Pararhodobacter sp. SW119 TaxID=2780075 RepID=UPI001AE0B63C|nr:head maturation protease, ClpP-related [Pararhodobacter sp. SW119]